MSGTNQNWLNLAEQALWPFSDESFMSGLRVETPMSHSQTYLEDRNQFNKLKKRRMFVRYSYDEFSKLDDMPTRKFGPTYVVVIKLAEGIHAVVPIWRGKSPCPEELLTDGEVAQVVSHCWAKGGYDKEEFQSWMSGRR